MKISGTDAILISFPFSVTNSCNIPRRSMYVVSSLNTLCLFSLLPICAVLVSCSKNL